jgi:hypothetical protein
MVAILNSKMAAKKHGFNAYLNFCSLYYSKYGVIIGDNKHVGTTSLMISDLGDKVIVIGVNKHVGTTSIMIAWRPF